MRHPRGHSTSESMSRSSAASPEAEPDPAACRDRPDQIRTSAEIESSWSTAWDTLESHLRSEFTPRPSDHEWADLPRQRAAPPTSESLPPQVRIVSERFRHQYMDEDIG